MNLERIEAMFRLLVDSGDMTPMAVRQLRKLLEAEDEADYYEGLERREREWMEQGWMADRPRRKRCGSV